MDTIIVGVDESDSAAEALRWAISEGATRGWNVRAVLAWTFMRQHRPDRTERHDPTYDDASAAEALTRYVVDAVGSTLAHDIQLQEVCELAGPALVAASEGSPLLVVGSRGLGGFGGLVAGSVSQHCLHHATCPVVVVREHDDRERVKEGKIVVGIDGSDTAHRALVWALDEARARGGVVEVVHSWLLPAVYALPSLAVPDLTVFEETAEKAVAAMLHDVDTSGLSGPVSTVVVGGTSTAGLLASRARDAELLVVGSRGVGGFEGMVIGSVAHHLAHHAPCPLVVLPAASC